MVIPFGEVRAERAELIAAPANIPGFGDQTRSLQNWVFGKSLEKRRIRVEAARAATERGREIEAEAVKAAVDHPPLQRADGHVDDQRPVEREAIAGAGVVDVERRIVRIEAEPGRVIEATERQRGPELIAFAAVVEDDVEDRLHTSRMQRIGRRANLRPSTGRKPRIGNAEYDRIIAPGVREAERRQMALIDEGVRRHDFDRRHAESREVGDRSRISQSREGSARAFGDCRVQARKAAQVELVDDEQIRRDTLAARLACGRRARDGFRRVGAAVVAEREHRGMQAERPVEGPGVGVGKQFGRVEASPATRVEGALDAETVARARAEAGCMAAKDASRVARHRGPEDFAVAVVKAERYALGVGQVERRLEAAGRHNDAEPRLCAIHQAVPASER